MLDYRKTTDCNTESNPNEIYIRYTLENTEGPITNGQCRETGNIGYTRRRKTKREHNANIDSNISKVDCI